MESEDHNITWQKNQALIQKAYYELAGALKRCPTIKEVSEKVNLGPGAIAKHVKELEFAPLDSPMRVLTPDIIFSIANSARKGSTSAQKLWLQVMEGWTEKSILDLNVGGKKSIADLVSGEDDEEETD